MRSWLDVMVDGLADAPQERVVSAVPRVLERIAGEKRTEVLGRVQHALAGRLDLLAVLADELYFGTWPGANWASAQVSLAILEQDPQSESAVQGITRALAYASEDDLARPLIDRAFTLTDRDPVLVLAWVDWLYEHDRAKEAEELLDLALSSLADAPQERVVSAMPRLLGRVEGEKRTELLQRIENSLAGRLDLLGVLADGLYYENWTGADWTSAQVYLAILTADPQRESAVEGIASALAYLSEDELARPLMDRALTSTNGDPVLLLAWGNWLHGHDGEKEAEDVSRLALSSVADRLADAPHDERLISAGMRGIGFLSEYEQAQPLVNRALTLTQHDPGLLLSWVDWLSGHDRKKEAEDLVDSAVSSLADRLGDAPQERVVSAVPRFLERVVDDEKRTELLLRVQDGLAGRLDLLAVLADGLYFENWPGADVATAQVSLAVLEQDPQSESAVQRFSTALALLSEYELAHRLVNRALTLTNRDPVLGVAWVDWLYVNHREREADDAVSLALSSLEDRLADSPQKRVVSAVPRVLGRMAGDKRTELLGRVQAMLAGQLDLLDVLADELFYENWPGAAWASAQVCLAVLEQDSQRESAIQGIARALVHVSEYDQAHPLVDQALTLTARDPVLVESWARWLLEARRPDDAEEFVLLGLRTGQPWPFVEQSHLSISEAYERRSCLAAAEHWLDKVSVIVPDDPLIAVRRANTWLWRNQPHKGLTALVTAMGSTAVNDTDRRALLISYVDCMSALGRQAEVMSQLEDPDSPQHGRWTSDDIGRLTRHEQLARLAISTGQLSQAHEHIEAAEAVIRESPSLPDNLAVLRLAVMALAGPPAALSSQETSVDELRAAANLVVIAGSAHALPLREEAARRADIEGTAQDAAFFELGIECSSIGRPQEAIQAFERSRSAWSGPVEGETYWAYGPYSLHNIASALEDAGDFAAATDRWKEANDEYEAYSTRNYGEYEEYAATDDPYLLWARSSVDQRLDRISEAFEACTRGLELDPDGLDLLSRMIDLGRDWEQSRARRAAEGSAVRVAGPSVAEVSAGDAHSLHSSDWRSREAIRRRRRLLKERAVASNNHRHFADYGEFLLDRAEHDEARRWIQRAIRGDGDEPFYHLILGRCYQATNDAKRAQQEFAQALALKPNDHEIRSFLGDAEAELGDRDAALAHYLESLDRAPAYIPTLISLANMYVDMAEDEREGYHLEQAIINYDRVLEHHEHGTGSKFLTSSEKAAILYQHGYCLVGLYERSARVLKRPGMLHKAREDFRKCLAIEPHHEKALRACEKLAGKAPGRTTLRERLAPWVVVACALAVFVFAQIRFYQFESMSEATYIGLSLGAVALTIAGFVLPELLKLKVGGVELEKGTVQQSAPTSFGLSR